MTADAEQIQVAFSDDHLTLNFVDIRKEPVEFHFQSVLAFRWSVQPSVAVPRGDNTYVIRDSEWLEEEARLEAVDPADYAHFLLGFNAAKTLEILAAKQQSAG